MSINSAGGGCVYMLANKMGGTLYAGVTSDLPKRASEHRAGIGSKFTTQHKVYQLVWYREFGSIQEAIKFETQLKGWRRDWKIKLIEEANPRWDDLLPQLNGRRGHDIRPLVQHRGQLGSG